MPEEACWICGDAATTGEHMIKKTDLEAIFGKPKRGSPLFLHNATQSNQIIQGLNADALKLGSRLCAPCNNARSQPYDRAWEHFSYFARNRVPSLTPGTCLRADRIYPMGSNTGLKFVQLFFVKLFGCLIHENKIPIDLKSFSKAFLNRTAHPDIFLRIGRVARDQDDVMVGVHGLKAVKDDRTGATLGAMWFYELDRFAIHVIYAPVHDLWEVTRDAWHPRLGTGRLIVHDFREALKAANEPVP